MSIDPIGFIPTWTLADRLRKARHTLAPCTQAQFAELIGANSKQYSQWEAGHNGPRDLVGVAQEVERVTGISAVWVLGLDSPRHDPGMPVNHRLLAERQVVPFARPGGTRQHATTTPAEEDEAA